MVVYLLKKPTIMKKAIITLFVLVLVTAAILLIWRNMGSKDGDPNKLMEGIPSNLKVRAEFEQNPPIAEDIYLELLDTPLSSGENVRLTARFSKEDIARIKEEFFAMQIGKEKVVLRNDGKGADVRGGDGVFSILLKEDLTELMNDLEQAKKAALASKRKNFDGRTIEMTQLDRKGLSMFNPRDLSSKRNVNIPIIIFPFIKGGAALKFPILADKSLMITDIGVVEDPTRTFKPCDFTAAAGNPNGVWTFGELMRQMASPSPGSIANDAATITFITNWLNTWSVPNTVNGDNIPARNIISVMNTWQSLSDQANLAAGNPVGPLLVERCPFRLMAIVNRLDLRGSSGYGFSDAGEGRLVFCALDNVCNSREFTVIFEYGINKKKCEAVKSFGQEWANLSDPALGIGTPAYNAALEAIILQFTQSGTNVAKPNQSSINQVRTNEIALAAPWELREFNLTTAGSLSIVDVKMEPARKFNTKLPNAQTQFLADYANTNEADILANTYEIPLVHLGTDFRGGAAHTQFPPTGAVNVAGNTPHHWDGRPIAPHLINNDDARHILSLNTCSGCHGGETQTFFTHIDPTGFGAPAGLSGFLTGTPGRGGAVDADGLANGIMSVLDPAGRPAGGPPVMRGFSDLQRRVDDLTVLVNQDCFSKSALGIANILTFKPLNMTH